jgi:hypothetical protein
LFASTITPLSLRLYISNSSIDLSKVSGTTKVERIKNYIDTLMAETKQAGMALLKSKT